MWHGLVAQDFVNIAKSNAYLLLGSAAPFLIIMSFLMVTVSSLQGPLRACLEILRHAARCYLGSSTRGESSPRRFKKSFGHVCASASGCRGCGPTVRQSMPGTLNSRVEIYAENGTGTRRLGAPHFRCLLRCLRSLCRTLYTSWRSRLMFSTLMWCAALIGRSTHVAEFRLLAADLDERGAGFGRQAGRAGMAGDRGMQKLVKTRVCTSE
jgi:hypothetical protein